MLNDERFQIIFDQIQTLLLYLDRPAVQQQIIAILMIIGLAWLLSKGMWRILNRRLSRQPHWQERLHNRTWFAAKFALEFTSFPLFGLGLLLFVIYGLESQNQLAALLNLAVPVLLIVLIYRLFVAALYLGLGSEVMKPYHRRLLAPLFTLMVGYWLAQELINLRLLGELVLFQWFDSAVTLGALVMAALAIYFLINVARALQESMLILVAPRTNLDPGAINAVLTIGRYIVVGIGVLIVWSALGFDATTLAVIGGGLSVGIGFGLQSIVSNFISGIVLLFEQSLRPGDIVKIGDKLGEVKTLSIRATTVRTFDNVDITVPNETLFTTSVTNYTQSSRVVRTLMNIGVSYSSDPKEVIALLLEIANEHGLVLEDPEPKVFFNEFGDSSLLFLMAVWVEDPSYLMSVPSDLRQMIWKRFRERGIEIPFPQRDLHIRSGGPWPQPDATATTPQTPATVDADAPLSPDRLPG